MEDCGCRSLFSILFYFGVYKVVWTGSLSNAFFGVRFIGFDASFLSLCFGIGDKGMDCFN